MYKLLPLIFAFTISFCFSFKGLAQKSNTMTPFEKDNNTTATYKEAIAFYKVLEGNPLIQMAEVGSTDSGCLLYTSPSPRD